MSATIKTVQDEMREANERLQAMVATATAEDRDFTEAEVQEKDALVARMTALDGKRKRGETFADLLASTGKLVPPAHGGAAPAAGGPNPYVPGPARKTWGEQFVATAEYLTLRAAPKTGRWQTPTVELQGAVTITPNYPTPPPWGLPIVAPLTYPEEFGIAGLFAPGTLDGGLIQYLQETFDNQAAVVAVGQPKPESHKTLTLVQQGLIKLAHFIPVPDEFLEDISGLQSLIDANLRNGIIEKLNDKLVNGPGTGGDMLGLIALTGKAPTIAAGSGVGAPAQAIAAQRAQVYTLSRLRPDAVVMNPLTWAGVSSQMSTAGGYLAGPATFGAGVPPAVWGLRVVETPEVPDGTAIVGAFRQGGQLYTKGGIAVQATNAHEDYFVKNLTAIRAEIRVALAVYRPLAFGLVTGLPVADTTPPTP